MPSGWPSSLGGLKRNPVALDTGSTYWKSIKVWEFKRLTTSALMLSEIFGNSDDCFFSTNSLIPRVNKKPSHEKALRFLVNAVNEGISCPSLTLWPGPRVPRALRSAGAPVVPPGRRRLTGTTYLTKCKIFSKSLGIATVPLKWWSTIVKQNIVFKARYLKWNTQAHLFSPSLNPKSLKQAALLFKVQWVETLLVSWLCKPHGACVGRHLWI